MEKRLFDILYYCKENKVANQRQISNALDISLGSTNKILYHCKSDSLLDNNYQLTKKGEKLLSKYKVDNAIIMAAGLSSRFVPLSYSRPKGLTVVKGEVLIERQIKQLKEAGINEIHIVVGYKKELFFYLKEKYNVNIIVNPDYATKGNYESILRAKEHLGNSYICSSDNYFTENIFTQYNYDSWYASQYDKGNTPERCVVTDKNDKILSTHLNGKDSWILIGPAYWSKNFSEEFIKILEDFASKQCSQNSLWEHIFNDNISNLPIMYAHKVKNCIYEFDNIDELKEFDPYYLKNCDPKIFDNITKVLNCKIDDLHDFELVKEGQTNNNFTFYVNKDKYIYRHTSKFTKSFIDRKNEANIEQALKKSHIDTSSLYINNETGWKISKFIEHANLDFDNPQHLKAVISTMKKVHKIKDDSFNKIDYTKMIEKMHKLVNNESSLYQQFFNELFPDVQKLIAYNKADNWDTCIIHGDINEENFLLDANDCRLIDWEYAGNGDPGFDIVRIIIKSENGLNRYKEILDTYYNGKHSIAEDAHIIACGAISYYFWLLWAIYLEAKGRNLENSILEWYQIVKSYSKKALELYEKAQ